MSELKLRPPKAEEKQVPRLRLPEAGKLGMIRQSGREKQIHRGKRDGEESSHRQNAAGSE